MPGPAERARPVGAGVHVALDAGRRHLVDVREHRLGERHQLLRTETVTARHPGVAAPGDPGAEAERRLQGVQTAPLGEFAAPERAVHPHLAEVGRGQAGDPVDELGERGLHALLDSGPELTGHRPGKFRDGGPDLPDDLGGQGLLLRPQFGR